MKPVSTSSAHELPSDQPSSIDINLLGNSKGSPGSPTDDTRIKESPSSKALNAGPSSPVFTVSSNEEPRRRRKRDRDEDDIEGMYMQRLTAEESRTTTGEDIAKSQKRQKLQNMRVEAGRSISPAVERSEVEDGGRDHSGSPDTDVPQHETLTSSREKLELDKSARTVFLANVSTSAIKSKNSKKELLDHLISFNSLLPASDKPHKIESLRFRSTPFVSGVGPKKAAYAKKELMDTTAKSTNAYVVYTSQAGAREAVRRLNGTMVLSRHLLVDSVAHPRRIDYRRCVFVGNLGFVDDDSQINAAKADQEHQKPRKSREPSDIEEGLWRHFGKVGSVESVRVVRDASTRVGKGFAYVQFQVSHFNLHLRVTELISLLPGRDCYGEGARV